MPVVLGKWYVSSSSGTLITERFLSTGEVVVCTDGNSTQVISRHDMEMNWSIVPERDPLYVEPPPKHDDGC